MDRLNELMSIRGDLPYSAQKFVDFVADIYEYKTLSLEQERVFKEIYEENLR